MDTSVNLFFLPYAGGNRYSYREYKRNAPSFLNIIPLEYPGRGMRMNEPLLPDIGILVNDLYNQIGNDVDKTSYAIYGHSMGGLVGYLLVRKLIEEKHRWPLHLFITATAGPSSASVNEKIRYNLPLKEFIEEVKNIGGIPQEILENSDSLSYFEPILRADFRACENYKHDNSPPLNIPITVIAGTEDSISMDDIYLWQRETNKTVDFKEMPGNHFFIFKYPAEIIRIMCQKLSVQLESSYYG